MNLLRCAALCLIFALFLLLGGATVYAQPLIARVTWVYDGDTIKVDALGKVRLLGIDTPEREDSARDDYYLRRGVKRERLREIAAAATGRVATLAKGRMVTLEVDGDGKDRHGRLLAYVYLPDGRLLNRLLLDEGLASVYRKFSFRLKSEFLVAEAAAQKTGLGLWLK